MTLNKGRYLVVDGRVRELNKPCQHIMPNGKVCQKPAGLHRASKYCAEHRPIHRQMFLAMITAKNAPKKGNGKRQAMNGQPDIATVVAAVQQVLGNLSR